MDAGEGEDDEEDEHIIVTMLRSMNSKKPEAGQLSDMNHEVDIEKIRSDVKLEYFKEIQSKIDEKLEVEWQARHARFDRIFNKIIAKKLMLDRENAYVKKIEEAVKQQEERLKNPFYTTLKAQKEERDKFIDFYSSGMIMGPQSQE